MMILLHDKLSPQVDISVLYSNVGTFYSRAKRVHEDSLKATGWEVVSPDEVTWPVDGSNMDTASSDVLQQVQSLDLMRLEEICKTDAKLLEQELHNCKHNKAFSIVPTEDQIEWQLARCRFYDELRHPPSRNAYPFIDNWGCEIGRPGDEDWGFAIWTYDVVDLELAILRLRCNSTEQLRQIVAVAIEAAKKQGMKKVTAWNVNEELLQGTGWKHEARIDHLPAMAWYGDGPAPEWLCNEHWAWC